MFGIDEHVAPDAPVVLARRPGHRRDEALVGALHPVARRLVAQRRLEPGVAVVQLDVVALVVVAGASARDGRSARGSPRGSCRRRSSSWPAACRPGAGAARAPRCRTGPAARRGPAPARRAAWACEVEVHEDEAGERLHAHREEAERRLVEARDRARLGHADQVAVEPVGPAVVAAADRLAALPRPGQQARAAVAADVAEGAQHAVLVAQHQHGLAARVGRDVAARARQAARRAPRTARCARRSARARAPRRRGRGRAARAARRGGKRLQCVAKSVLLTL